MSRYVWTEGGLLGYLQRVETDAELAEVEAIRVWCEHTNQCDECKTLSHTEAFTAGCSVSVELLKVWTKARIRLDTEDKQMHVVYKP